jgi:hypothetical protein
MYRQKTKTKSHTETQRTQSFRNKKGRIVFLWQLCVSSERRERGRGNVSLDKAEANLLQGSVVNPLRSSQETETIYQKRSDL